MTAGAIVSFTGNGGKGGRHIEHGIGIALHTFNNMYRIIVIGERENIFHCHPATEIYADWNEFLASEIQRLS